jgi:hypothetical protein
MTEPDWTPFVIDREFDAPGVKLQKIQGFMRTFIEWRADLAEPSTVPEQAKTPTKPSKKAARRRASK